MEQNNSHIPNVERPFKHTISIQMRFNDIDMLGHLNNSMYFAYFDTGKSEYFGAVCGVKNYHDRLNVVIANVNCDFIAPVYYKENIVVKTQITQIHNKSFNLLQAIVNQDTGEIKAMCRTVMVGFSPDKGTSVPLSEEWKNAVINYEGLSTKEA